MRMVPMVLVSKIDWATSIGVPSSASSQPMPALLTSTAISQRLRERRNAIAFARVRGQEHRLYRKHVTMARTPNYNFERQERERVKKQKTAARAEAKLKLPVEETKSDTPHDTPTED
jgi:hypothetical protein